MKCPRCNEEKFRKTGNGYYRCLTCNLLLKEKVAKLGIYGKIKPED